MNIIAILIVLGAILFLTLNLSRKDDQEGTRTTQQLEQINEVQAELEESACITRLRNEAGMQPDSDPACLGDVQEVE